LAITTGTSCGRLTGAFLVSLFPQPSCSECPWFLATATHGSLCLPRVHGRLKSALLLPCHSFGLWFLFRSLIAVSARISFCAAHSMGHLLNFYPPLALWKGWMPRSSLSPFQSFVAYLMIDQSSDCLFVLDVNIDNYYLLTPEPRASTRPVTKVLQREYAASEHRTTEQQISSHIESLRPSPILHAYTAHLLFSPIFYSTLLRLLGTTPSTF
jgi:hypothetical protein